MKRHCYRAYAVLSILLPCAPSLAQDVLHYVSGNGQTVSGLGDVDGDGFDDFLLADPAFTVSAASLPWDGRVQVISGQDGSVVYEYIGNGNALGSGLAGLGDLNGDGIPDFGAGAPGSSNDHVFVYSGLDGSILFDIDDGVDTDHAFGERIAAAGDVNNDGQLDFLVADWRYGPPNSLSGNGRIQVFSGSDGSILLEVLGTNVQGGRTVGASVVGGLDLDGDGFADMLTGGRVHPTAPFTDIVRSVYAFAGVDGSLLYQVDAMQSSPPLPVFGMHVASIGDVNADGRDDFVVGDRFDGSGGAGAGRAVVYSGIDGAVLYEVHGATGEGLGNSVGRMGDLNGDGVSEILVGVRDRIGASLRPAVVAVHSGADGGFLFEVQNPDYEWTNFAQAIAGVGDVNADGVLDFVVGAGIDYVAGDERAVVISGYQDCNSNGLQDWEEVAAGSAPDNNGNGVPDSCEFVANGTSYCTPKTDSNGCVPSVQGVGTPSIGATEGFVVVASGTRRFVNGLFFYGITPGTRPFMGGTICMRPPYKRTPVRNSGGSNHAFCSGRFVLDFNSILGATSPVVVGQTLYTQVYYRDVPGSFGVGLSDAFAFVVGP